MSNYILLWRLSRTVIIKISFFRQFRDIILLLGHTKFCVRCLLQARNRFVASLLVVSVVSPTVQIARNIRTYIRATSRTIAVTPAVTRPTLTRRRCESTSSRMVVNSRQSSYRRRRRHRCDRRSSPTSRWWPGRTPAVRHRTTTTRDAPLTRATTPTPPTPTNPANSGVASTCSSRHRKRKWLAPCWYGTGIR